MSLTFTYISTAIQAADAQTILLLLDESQRGFRSAPL
jgi:hypothetical protein